MNKPQINVEVYKAPPEPPPEDEIVIHLSRSDAARLKQLLYIVSGQNQSDMYRFVSALGDKLSDACVWTDANEAFYPAQVDVLAMRSVGKGATV